MHPRLVVLALLTALAASCKTVDCGDGTIERNGACVPADETVGTARCGPFTELHGDQCEPMLPPTVCDPATTTPDVDDMGVTTCIGTGGGGCAARLACPAPTDGKQTICGQLYDFETNQPFAQAGARGTPCAAGATAGPCALGIRTYDAVAFAANPTIALPLPTGGVDIDDCGRYQISEITLPGSPFIALAIDDATLPGPAGITHAVGLATGAAANTATKDFEAFIVRPSTTASWAGSGGPPLDAANGIYAAIFRSHRAGTDLASGVTFAVNGNLDASRDYYLSNVPGRTAVDGAATATGVNGTALLTRATLVNELYSGKGGAPAECAWDGHLGASIPYAIFIQIFRPSNAPDKTCPL
jgi:hypothetical protein